MQSRTDRMQSRTELYATIGYRGYVDLEYVVTGRGDTTPVSGAGLDLPAD